ncbi:MAG: ECF transporter S component [Eubacterium sp.]
MANSETKKKVNVRAICFTAIMAALIFVFTYTFKIPLGNGYTHLGDSIIFLSIALIGSKRSSFAAGLGAALADIIGGYAVWGLPTFIIKFGMALICGIFAEKLLKNKTLGYIVGCIIGGAFQIGAYTLAKVILFDRAYAVSTLPTLSLQTVVGIVIALVFIFVFNKSGATNKLKKIAKI